MGAVIWNEFSLESKFSFPFGRVHFVEARGRGWLPGNARGTRGTQEVLGEPCLHLGNQVTLICFPCMLSHFSRVRLCDLWTIAHQDPLSMEFSRWEHWSGLPCPPSGDLLGPGIKPVSPLSPALGGGFFTLVPPGKPQVFCRFIWINSWFIIIFLASVTRRKVQWPFSFQNPIQSKGRVLNPGRKT